LDAQDNEDLLGTLAGDDTILLIAADTPGAERLVTWLGGLG
jgi:arginine repressor